MLDSRRIEDLRPDVAANVRLWISECWDNGLDIALSSTKRDNEYQAYLFTLGRTIKKKPDGSPQGIVTNGKTTTWHGAGLACDFYSKSKGWSDHSFFVRCAAIAKKYGFSWSGDWKSFVEYAHIQWDNHGKANYKNAPQMPLYQAGKETDDDMTQEQFNKMMDNYMSELANLSPSEWSKEARQWAESNGIIIGDEHGDKKYKALCTREQMVQFLYRAKG